MPDARRWSVPLAFLLWGTLASSAQDAPAQRPRVTASASPIRHDPVYPGSTWTRIVRPDQAGWSSARLATAHRYAGSIGSAAVMIVHRGVVVGEWGETSHRFHTHSMRKSLLSALFGIYSEEGRINVRQTLGELGIDDTPPALTPQEKRARVIDLLRLRSGVYHVANAESDYMRRERPPRGSHAPGTHWYYNNWDIHALTTILERQTGTPVPKALERRIARPLQMQDFRASDVYYESGPHSMYPGWGMRMSTRDLARFGLLYLRGGRWQNRQIVPEAWVRESTRYAAEEVGPYDGWEYGAMGSLWWVTINGKHIEGVNLGPGAFSARGSGGHAVVVIPIHDLVVVHRMDTDRGDRATDGQVGRLLRLILEAKQ